MGTNEGKIAGHYERSELELMTTFQLREICRREKIMNGIIQLLDKEKLIWTIMRYMGKRQDLLIREEKKGGRERPSLVRRTETGKFTISYARFWAV